mgnify:CR=1 FL=1
MKITKNIITFLEKNHMGVMTTFRENGMPQLSIVSVGLFKEGVAFSTTQNRAKLGNLKRNQKCSLLVSQDDWREYIVLEGNASLLCPDVTDPDELRIALRDVYKTASGSVHPDWMEFDLAMVKDDRCVVLVVPNLLYGNVPL